MNIKTSTRNGRPVMASIGPVGGGGGGTPFGDGSDGAGGATGFLRNTPIEISEAEVPIRFLRYGLYPDTGAPGKYRGGLSAVMEFQISAPETIVTARNRNRSIMPSWGVRGAQAGKVSHFVRNPDQPDAENLGNADVVRCNPGDVIRVIGPGAGGYGNPFERGPEAVLRDVRQGYVSPESAEADYGVVLSDGQLDRAVTDKLRSERTTGTVKHFSYGAERVEFEKVWTEERYALLTKFLAGVPVGWRFFLKHRIFDAVAADGDQPVAAQMERIFGIMREKYAL
jgi:N-methylhydantoinase B